LKQDAAAEIQSAFKSSKLTNMLGGGVLTLLDWEQVYLSDEGLEKITSACPAIVDLNLTGVRSTFLNVASTNADPFCQFQCTKLTDAGLKHLARLNQLKKLQLDDLNVTDIGIVELAESPAGKNLDFLSVRRCTKLTDDSLMVR